MKRHATPRVIRAVPVQRLPMARKAEPTSIPLTWLVLAALVGLSLGWLTAPWVVIPR